MIGESDDKTNLSHRLLLTDRQNTKFRKDFANNLSANIKLSKTQLSKIVESGGFLSRLLGLLLKTGLPLMKNVLKPLAKNVSIPTTQQHQLQQQIQRIHKNIFVQGQQLWWFQTE